MLGLAADGGGPVVPGERGFLPFRAPVGFRLARRNGAKPGDGAFTRAHHADIAAAQDSREAIDSLLAIEIADADSQTARAHEGVQGLVEEHARGLRYLVRQILSRSSLAGGRVVLLAQF